MKTKIHICSKRATERSAIYHPVAEFIYKENTVYQLYIYLDIYIAAD